MRWKKLLVPHYLIFAWYQHLQLIWRNFNTLVFSSWRKIRNLMRSWLWICSWQKGLVDLNSFKVGLANSSLTKPVLKRQGWMEGECRSALKKKMQAKSPRAYCLAEQTSLLKINFNARLPRELGKKRTVEEMELEQGLPGNTVGGFLSFYPPKCKWGEHLKREYTKAGGSRGICALFCHDPAPAEMNSLLSSRLTALPLRHNALLHSSPAYTNWHAAITSFSIFL